MINAWRMQVSSGVVRYSLARISSFVTSECIICMVIQQSNNTKSMLIVIAIKLGSKVVITRCLVFCLVYGRGCDVLMHMLQMVL